METIEEKTCDIELFPSHCEESDIYFETIDSTLLEYMIDYSLWFEDDKLNSEKNIWLAVETMPLRTSEVFDQFPLTDSGLHSGKVMIPTIQEQDSLVIGFWFKGRGNTQLNHTAYTKIKVNKGGSTRLEKRISADDIWNKPCQFQITLSQEPDFNFHTCMTSSVVGNPEHYSIYELPPDQESFSFELECLEEYWRKDFEEWKSSGKCGEIYVNIF